MKAFKNALRIILPHLSRNKRVLRVNLEAIIPYSVQQLTVKRTANIFARIFMQYCHFFRAKHHVQLLLSIISPQRQTKDIKKDSRCMSTENLFPMFETFQTFVTEFCYAAFCLLHRLLPVEMGL